MSVFIFILVLSFLVIIHELGHFFAARKVGMKIEEFGIGYPPRAFKLFKWQETTFSVNWIPFGGFVAIEGEDEARQAPQQSALKTSRESRSHERFNDFSTNSRLLVILAGPITNFIFGIIAFGLIFSISGIPTQLNQARIKVVSPNSPAQKAGLMEDVNLVSIKIKQKSYPISSIKDAVSIIGDHRGETVTVTTTGKCQKLKCDTDHNQIYEVYLRTKKETPPDQGSMGIVFQSVIYLKYPWYEAPFRGAWFGLMQAVDLGRLIFASLGQLISTLITFGHVPDEIAGPVGIVYQASTEGIFTEGYLAILSFAGMLSINLAVMNILPIPALDGGRALFILIEKLTGRKKIEKIELYANYVGYFLLLALIISVTIKDVMRIFV